MQQQQAAAAAAAAVAQGGAAAGGQRGIPDGISYPTGDILSIVGNKGELIPTLAWLLVVKNQSLFRAFSRLWCFGRV